MKEYDDRRLDNTVDYLFRRIRHKIRECEENNIDVDTYVDKDYLYRIIDVLDCCLNNKDSRNIVRIE